MGELRKLKGLGIKSEQCLSEVGIHTKAELEQVGPVNAYIRLKRECSIKPGLNFLYAMVGALEDSHWKDIANKDRERLLNELDGYFELEEIFKDD